jgi:hypothetical protein
LVATARDKLIAEWHERLAAAEAADTDSLSRPAWLARLQIRLYRFLLSLYGKGDWTTTPPPRLAGKSVPESAADSVIFDSPDALLLRGKPAKSAGKIQSVLKAVANAQDTSRLAGPLTAENWVKVAGARPHGVAQRCAEFFRARGICARAVDHGHESSIEVSACEFNTAITMLPSIIAAMSSAKQRSDGSRRVVVRRGGPPTAFTNFLVMAVMVGPILAMVLTLTTSVIATAFEGRLVDIHQGSIFLASWMAINIAAAIAYLTPFANWLRFKRRVPASESPAPPSRD